MLTSPGRSGRDYGRKARRRDAERARKAARSGLVRELAAEVEGAPEEVRLVVALWNMVQVPGSCGTEVFGLGS